MWSSKVQNGFDDSDFGRRGPECTSQIQLTRFFHPENLLDPMVLHIMWGFPKIGVALVILHISMGFSMK